MNTNSNNSYSDVSDEITVLGVASTDTKGGPLAGEEIGGFNVPGISEE
ncbi:benenodin family lasso peptide [Xanthomonas hortorum]|uniref:Benenodin family lasso peptide n=1 Tax=Xanthomonas hortorum pv. hederae TaxID=453603 RepID=A0A9X4BUW2_9XANT|nr:benenodin family lasso peptide [Xanthomonas hortorum]MCE4372549.1 benenodin family lasso peptide [Xanthomonas hortorum pv. hederae]MDC8640012.1 benenodin family lasso peptide [Xanthomonas hortorum pv. hederae]PUE97269.1 benenodin family lasso peptide [Xanthomonas hortorum pv. hederae]